MLTLIREVVDIPECSSIDLLVERLVAVRDRLPDPSEANVRIRGDDFVGNMITITYFREMTPDEAEIGNFGVAA